MKYCLAATTVAALLAAAPASAQTVYGMVTPPSDDGQGFGTNGDGTFRGNVVIYASIDPVLPAAAQGTPVFASAPGSFTGDVAATAVTSSASSAVVSPPVNATAVPEPATWAMMLIGFGAVGTALRTRRKATLRIA